MNIIKKITLFAKHSLIKTNFYNNLASITKIKKICFACKMTNFKYQNVWLKKK